MNVTLEKGPLDGQTLDVDNRFIFSNGQDDAAFLFFIAGRPIPNQTDTMFDHAWYFKKPTDEHYQHLDGGPPPSQYECKEICLKLEFVHQWVPYRPDIPLDDLFQDRCQGNDLLQNGCLEPAVEEVKHLATVWKVCGACQNALAHKVRDEKADAERKLQREAKRDAKPINKGKGKGPIKTRKQQDEEAAAQDG